VYALVYLQPLPPMSQQILYGCGSLRTGGNSHSSLSKQSHAGLRHDIPIPTQLTPGDMVASGMNAGYRHAQVAQIAATALGIPLSAVFIAETATDKVPNASSTAASASSDLYGAAGGLSFLNSSLLSTGANLCVAAWSRGPHGDLGVFLWGGRANRETAHQRETNHTPGTPRPISLSWLECSHK